MAQSCTSLACIHWGALPVQIAGADTNTVGDRDAAGASGRMVAAYQLAAVGVCHTAVSLRAGCATPCRCRRCHRFPPNRAAPGSLAERNARWRTDPPANDGAKVILSDTDHYSPFGSDALWAWKSLLRGDHPVLYDFGIIDVVHPLDPSFGVPAYESYEPARLAKEGSPANPASISA
jgi:hypothetical protein